MGALTVVVSILIQSSLIFGDQVIRFQLKTQEQINEINDLAEKLLLDVWQPPSLKYPGDIHVTKATKDALVAKLTEWGIKHEITVNDLEKAIILEKKDNLRAKYRSLYQSYTYSFRKPTSVVGYFARHAEINKWLNSLASTEPIASIVSIGKSYEGRDMQVIKLSTGLNRPAVLMDGAIHAREWISTATVNYIINKLVTGYRNGDATAVSMLSRFDFYFLPVANPDGYEYTFTNDRQWRKSRQPWVGGCIGVDLNRNFDSHFGFEGASSYPCSSRYHGPYPFSEPETANIRDFVLGIRRNLKLYFNIHSYSQLWLVPWGWSSTRPSDDSEMRRVANIGNNALARVNGVRFVVDSPPNILYAAAGVAYDWVKEVAGVKYSYTFELRPSRNSFNGFVVSTSTITPSGEEVYAGVMAAANAIKF